MDPNPGPHSELVLIQIYRVDFRCQLAVVQFGQGYLSMSPPTKEIERLVVAGKLTHPNNAVLNWCASNVVIEMDPAGNIKPSRRKSTEKIDGVVALAMAVGTLMAKEPPEVLEVYLI